MANAIFLVPALALIGTAPAPVADAGRVTTRLVSPVPQACKPVGAVAQSGPMRPEMKRLGELPPAETYMAVYRTDARGCLDPLLARDRQGIRGR